MHPAIAEHPPRPMAASSASSGQRTLSGDTVKSRHEAARLAYLNYKFSVSGLRVADIGGNTGFFSFGFVARSALRVDHYERNKAHHDFVRASAQQLGVEKRLHTFHRHVTFSPGELPEVDCTVCLNVLHHFGTDSGDPAINAAAARQNIASSLGALAHSTRFLILQLGHHWKDLPDQPLFAHVTTAAQIDFVTEQASPAWFINSIGVAEKTDGRTSFQDLNRANAAHDESLGEFLHRPIFILQSKRR